MSDLTQGGGEHQRLRGQPYAAEVADTLDASMSEPRHTHKINAGCFPSCPAHYSREREAATPPLDVERLIWPLIESYPGRVEIDNVQRFREHLRRARLAQQDGTGE